MRQLTNEEKVTLEGLIDSSSLEHVLNCLSEIAWGKAEHLDSNWQDRNAARAWERAGERIAIASVHPSVQTVSR